MAVSRGWRAAVSEPSLWSDINLNNSSAPPAGRVTNALLAACVVKAAGRLASLRVEVAGEAAAVAALGVFVAHAATLRQTSVLCLPLGTLPEPGKHALFDSCCLARVREALESVRLGAAHLEVDVTCGDAEQLLALLHNRGPYAPVRLRRLRAFGAGIDRSVVAELAQGLKAHASLRELIFSYAPLDEPAALEAVVDAAVGARLAGLSLHHVSLNPTSVPSIARLLRLGEHLTALLLQGDDASLFDSAASGTLFMEALRTRASLAVLHLECVDLWRTLDTADAVVTCICEHPSLITVSLGKNEVMFGHRRTVGASLARLLTHMPRLCSLCLHSCALGEEGFRPVVEALRDNASVSAIMCDDNMLTRRFVRNEFLPAVRANTSLRVLRASCKWQGPLIPELEDAEALVCARR